MQRGRLYLRDDGRVLVDDAMRTTSALERMRGLLARPPLSSGQGLLIQPCNAVHTVGMGYPIDVVFLDRGLAVMKVVAGLRPWRMAACRGASSTLELAAGDAKRLALRIAQRLEWQT